MIIIHVTTSCGSVEYSLPIPFADEIELIYNDCKYCGGPTKREKFCCDNHRVQYFQKQIGKPFTSVRKSSPFLTACK